MNRVVRTTYYINYTWKEKKTTKLAKRIPFKGIIGMQYHWSSLLL